MALLAALLLFILAPSANVVAQSADDLAPATRAIEQASAGGCRYAFVMSYTGTVGNGPYAAARAVKIRFDPQGTVGFRYAIEGDERPEHAGLMFVLERADTAGYPGDLRTLPPTGELAFRDLRRVEAQNGETVYAFRPEVTQTRPWDQTGGRFMMQLDGALTIARDGWIKRVHLRPPPGGLREKSVGLATVEHAEVLRDYVRLSDGQVVLRAERMVSRSTVLGFAAASDATMTISDVKPVCDPVVVADIEAREKAAAARRR